MKAIFPLCHDINYQSRPAEFIKALHIVGIDDIVLVTYTQPQQIENGVRTVLAKEGKYRYFDLISKTVALIKKEKPNIVLLHDNTCAPLLKKLKKMKYSGTILFDSSELYIDKKKVKSFKQFLINRYLPYCEKKYLRYADVVFAANEDRAKIMKDYFCLDKLPVVLENMRPLELSFDEEKCVSKYGVYLNKNTFIVLYGGGMTPARRTLELVKLIIKLGKEYSLIIVGDSEKAEEEKFNAIISEADFQNVFYTGKIPRNEWKFLIQNSNVCVSIYAVDTLNNKYCASGRFYESIFEGVPVLASENPPLKSACDKFHFGISDNDFERGLTELKNNYGIYRHNAVEFRNQFDNEKRINDLANSIAISIEQKNKRK